MLLRCRLQLRTVTFKSYVVHELLTNSDFFCITNDIVSMLVHFNCVPPSVEEDVCSFP